jgi:serine/threonine-protein kinase RsbW
VLNNIVKYGYGEGAAHQIDVSITLEGNDLTVTFTDDGMAFNPLEAPPPDLSVSLQDRDIGGLGLHILRKMMDIIDYCREGDKNVLRMCVKV